MKKHDHSLDSFKMVNVEIDNPKYSIGEHGVWAFLVRYCKCGKEVAFDYGHRKDMEDKLELLIGA